MLRCKTYILIIGMLFLLFATSEASASIIASSIDWLGNSTLGWLKLTSTVESPTIGHNYDYTYVLSFDTDTEHPTHYGEVGGQEYVMHFKVLNPFKLPVYELTTPSGWGFNTSSPDYFLWQTGDYAYRLRPDSGGGTMTFAMESDYPPTRAGASAWDGLNAATGLSYAPVPEPTSMLLLGMGILGLYGVGRKRKI